MPLEIHLKPVETMLFRSDLLAVGKFRCPATHPLFRDSGPCSHHTFVFPRRATAIRFDDGRSMVGTPRSVLLYNQNQRYTRRKISDVDESDWYTLADDLLFEMLEASGRRVDRARPFAYAEAGCDAASFLLQRRVFDALDTGRPIEPLAVEETILGVLSSILARADERPPFHPRRQDVDVDAVEHAREIIARDPGAAISLRSLARRCSVSPFHLSRTFRARTGETITSYRHSLRLRLALQRLREGESDLTQLALELGYSSHSHFTAVFRRYFGVTPSRFRSTA